MAALTALSTSACRGGQEEGEKGVSSPHSLSQNTSEAVPGLQEKTASGQTARVPARTRLLGGKNLTAASLQAAHRSQGRAAHGLQPPGPLTPRAATWAALQSSTAPAQTLLLDRPQLAHPACLRREEGVELAVKEVDATAVQPPPPPALTPLVSQLCGVQTSPRYFRNVICWVNACILEGGTEKALEACF